MWGAVAAFTMAGLLAVGTAGSATVQGFTDVGSVVWVDGSTDDPGTPLGHRAASREVRLGIMRRMSNATDRPVPDPRRPHVLVVDDDASLRGFFADLLEDDGYRVSLLAAAPSPEEVVRLAPDLVVLDFRLGGGADGAGLLNRLRDDPATRAVPVVVCTGAVAEVEALRPWLADRGARVVLKPFDLDDLLDALAAVLGRGGADCP